MRFSATVRRSPAYEVTGLGYVKSPRSAIGQTAVNTSALRNASRLGLR